MLLNDGSQRRRNGRRDGLGHGSETSRVPGEHMTSEPIGRWNKLKPLDPRASVCNFIGAGFGAASHFKLPTMVGFLAREIEWSAPGSSSEPGKAKATSFMRGDPERLLNTIEEEYGNLTELSLEDVMADLHIRAFGIGRSWEWSDIAPSNRKSVAELKRDYEDLISYIVLRLRMIDVAKGLCELVKKFVKSLKAQDAVVTLNYDPILEAHFDCCQRRDRLERLKLVLSAPTEAMEPCLGPRFPSSDAGPRVGAFVKLHGSTDWVSCPNQECPNYRRVQPIGEVYTLQRASPDDARCNVCGWSRELVIIPPAMEKGFGRFLRLNMMWAQSYLGLCHAQRWTFIGLSFAATDFSLSALLRAASRNAIHFGNIQPVTGQICVVNKDRGPTEESARRLLTVLSPQVQRRVLSGQIALSLFESVNHYMDEVKAVDENRQGPPG